MEYYVILFFTTDPYVIEYYIVRDVPKLKNYQPLCVSQRNLV